MSFVAEPTRARDHERRKRGVALRNLAKSFSGERGRVHAVRGIDVSIAIGETVALLGPNGAGKSTTIDMLLGLLEPDGGTVSIFGGSPHQAVAAGRVGAMLQVGSSLVVRHGRGEYHGRCDGRSARRPPARRAAEGDRGPARLGP